MAKIIKKASRRIRDATKGKTVSSRFSTIEMQDTDGPDISVRTLIHPSTGEVFTYYFRPQADPFPGAGKVPLDRNQYPVVVDSRGAQWTDANLYILWLAKTVFRKMKTLWSTACDLGAYKIFLDEEELDHLDFPSIESLRPTYRYRARLEDACDAGELARSTARRRINAVVRFYRWILAEDASRIAYPAFVSKKTQIRTTTRTGSSAIHEVQTTDLALSVPQSEDPHDEHIIDDGKLRPLTKEEQALLIETLQALKNTEMTMAHLIAIFTGARIQTVLTLRAHQFSASLPARATEIRLPIGPQFLVDTKNSKPGVIYIPAWLYERVRIYLQSERYLKRRNKVEQPENQSLIFLTRNGTPMYDHSSTRLRFDPDDDRKYFREGGVVRVFIKDHVIPRMQKVMPGFKYRFHDLRATFGMNLADIQNKRVENNEIGFGEALSYVQARMGHEHFETTERYLGYRKRLDRAVAIQTAFEEHLQEIMAAAKLAL